MYFHSKNENTYGIILVFKGNYISILRIEIYYLYIQVLYDLFHSLSHLSLERCEHEWKRSLYWISMKSNIIIVWKVQEFYLKMNS